MNPTNESIGRAIDTVIYNDDDLRTIVQDWDESDPFQKTAMDLALRLLNHREAARSRAGYPTRELDRQAPGVPDWQSVADQMAAAIAPGEWVMVDRDRLERWRDQCQKIGRYDGHRCDFRIVTEAIEQSIGRTLGAPQPPAQEQGEDIAQLIRFHRATDEQSLIRKLAAENETYRARYGVAIDSDPTRAAGAEDARDAQRFRDLCVLVQDGTLVLGSYDKSDDAEYFDGVDDIPPELDRLSPMAEMLRRVQARAAITSQAQEGKTNE